MKGRYSMLRVIDWNLKLMCYVVAMVFVMQTHAGAQQQPRPSRRTTNPVPGQRPPLPPADDIRIISTAEEGEAAERQAEEVARPARSRNTRVARSSASTDERTLRRTVEQLSQQVTKLSAELTDMREQQRTLVDLERLSRTEQRAENYRTQLRDVVQREAALQARLDQIEIEILPENIEVRAAGAGSLRAEQVRDQMRRLLENERTRTRSQLDLLMQNRTQLEQAIARTDAEVTRLSERLDDTARTTAPVAPPPNPPTEPTIPAEPNNAEPTNAEPPRM
jgi:hypothetical protein